MNEAIVIVSAITSLVVTTLYILLVVKYNRRINETVDSTDVILEYCLEKTIERYIETEQYEKAEETTQVLNYLRSRYE